MSLDAPRTLGFWSIRLAPPLAGALGLLGVVLTTGAGTALSGLLVVFAGLLEWNGWRDAARRRGRSLMIATLTGACVCAIALGLSSLSAPSGGTNQVALR